MSTDQLSLLKGNFKNFLIECWRCLGLPPPTRMQLDLADYLQDNGSRRRMLEAFRGIGKSWVTAAYVCWRLLRDPQQKFLVVSASKKLADNFSTFCLQLINLVPELEHLKPTADQREAKVQFDVGPATAAKDPSVTSVGVTGMMTGSHVDELIADDIETPNNSQTQMMREKLAELIKEFEAILNPGGRITFLGTPQCEDSIYKSLPGKGYAVRIWPARYPKEKMLAGYNGLLAPIIQEALAKNPELEWEPTDPDRFSEAELAEREASYGRSGFMLQFMLDTSLSDASRYPLKLADLMIMSCNPELGPPSLAWASGPDQICADLPNVGFGGDRLYRPMFIEEKGWIPYSGSVLAIDPSGRGQDETGYAVIKMLHGTLYVVAWGGKAGGYSPETLTFLANLAKEHRVNTVMVESNFGDGLFNAVLTPYLVKTHPCALEEVRHSIQKEKRIIDTLEPVMNGHRLVIDRKVIEEDYRSVSHLPSETADKYRGCYQLTRLTKDRGSLLHDDRIDALAIGVAYWTEQLARSQDQALKAHKEDLWDKEQAAFGDEISGGVFVKGQFGNPGRQWADSSNPGPGWMDR